MPNREIFGSSVSSSVPGWTIVTDPAYGAKGDGVLIGDGAITSGLTALTSASAAFTSADVGKAIVVRGAGALLSGGATIGTITSASTGGSIVGGTTVAYRVAAVSSNGGVTQAGTEVTYSVPAGTNTNTVTIPWTAVTGATGYKVFGRTSGAELLIALVNRAQTSYTDLGSVTPAGALPGSNTATQHLVTTIAAYVSSTQVTLAAPSSTTVTNANVEYGTDNTAALDAAIAAALPGGHVHIPSGRYLRTTPLVITKNLTVTGDHAGIAMASLNTAFVFDVPSKVPYVQGSVIVQTTAGADVIQLTGTANSVNIKDIVLAWRDDIRHTNTGHGVYAVPTSTYSSGHDHGLYSPRWDNVWVWGVDGNHYGFYILNPLYCQFDHLHSFGGGGIYVECDSYAGNYGNMTITAPYVAIYCQGTAYGIRLKGRANGATGYLNLITMIRPQVVMENNAAVYAEALAPDFTTAQYGFYAQALVGNLAVIQPDIEPVAGSSVPPVLFNDGQRFITSDGYYGSLQNSNWKQILPTNGGRITYSDNGAQGISQASTVSAQTAGAGAGGPVPVGTNNGTYGGSVTFGTGTSPAANAATVRVAFSQFRGTAYQILLTPTNTAAAALGLYVGAKTGNNFDIYCGSTPAASQANTTYSFDYFVTFGQ